MTEDSGRTGEAEGGVGWGGGAQATFGVRPPPSSGRAKLSHEGTPHPPLPLRTCRNLSVPCLLNSSTRLVGWLRAHECRRHSERHSSEVTPHVDGSVVDRPSLK